MLELSSGGGALERRLEELMDPRGWDEGHPANDRRVVWLLDELAKVFGPVAMRHLAIDIRRKRNVAGRSKDTGSASVPIDDVDRAGRLVQEPDQEPVIDANDIRFAWIGLVAAAEREFEPDDDVLRLLRALRDDPELEADFGSQWPIRAIANCLNAQHPADPWTDRRVDNAKEKLMRWVLAMKRKHGMDDVDLRSMLACLGRKIDAAAGAAARIGK